MDKPALRFSIAPDTHPDCLPGWHIFLRHVQKQLDVSIKIADYANFSDLRQGLEQDQVDMIFASAADTSYLVSHKDFLALAQPESNVTEIVVLCRIDAPYTQIEDIVGNVRTIVFTDSPEIKHLGLILLEPADLNHNEVSFMKADNHLLTAKKLVNGEADLAFIPTEIYMGWSETLRKSVRPLVQTLKDDVEGLNHVLLLSPSQAQLAHPLKQILSDINQNSQHASLLNDINISQWQVLQDNSDIDFLIDLVDTLQI